MSKDKKLYHLGLTVRVYTNVHCYAMDEDDARRIAESYDGVLAVEEVHELQPDDIPWGDCLGDDLGVEQQNKQQQEVTI